MGFIQVQSLNISEIITETATEPSPILLEEEDDTEELKKQKSKNILDNRERNVLHLWQT